MRKKLKESRYYCKYCKTTELIPDGLDNINLSEIVNVFCPCCLAKGKTRMMLKIINGNQTQLIERR